VTRKEKYLSSWNYRQDRSSNLLYSFYEISMVTKKINFYLFMLLNLLFLSSCNKVEEIKDDGLSFLDCSAYYLEDMTLPEGAILQVRLEDISQMDVVAELISSNQRTIKSAPPYALQLAFPRKLIKMGHRYTLRALITLEGELLFTSTTYINPFAVGIASPIEIEVEQIKR